MRKINIWTVKLDDLPFFNLIIRLFTFYFSHVTLFYVLNLSELEKMTKQEQQFDALISFKLHRSQATQAKRFVPKLSHDQLQRSSANQSLAEENGIRTQNLRLLLPSANLKPSLTPKTLIFWSTLASKVPNSLHHIPPGGITGPRQ